VKDRRYPLSSLVAKKRYICYIERRAGVVVVVVVVVGGGAGGGAGGGRGVACLTSPFG